MRIISGEFKGRKLKTVEGPGYRPATSKVREALFNMLQARGAFAAGVRVLDVFAGSGSLGVEALSRGAELAVFIEMNKRAAGVIRENLVTLGVSSGRWSVLTKDFKQALSVPPKAPFDIVFVDPPYRKDLLLPAVSLLLEKGWIVEDGSLVAEIEADLDLEPNLGKEALEEVLDRTYGQTRIIQWIVQNAK